MPCDIGIFEAHNAFLVRTETKEVYAAVPHYGLVDNSKFLMKIGFVFDGHSILSESFRTLINRIAILILKILGRSRNYRYFNAAFNNWIKDFHKTCDPALSHKRTDDQNLALSVLQIIANGLTTVPTHELMDFILKYVEKEPVERIIVGHPKQMNNEDSENMKRIIPFVNQLKKKLPQIPIEMVDERFTSVLAHQAMLDGGLKKKARQDKALVDEISATIILQSYMESKKYQFKF